jgi:hypothetical protein
LLISKYGAGTMIVFCFLLQEVFKSEISSSISMTQVIGKCFVMNVKDYFKMKPEVSLGLVYKLNKKVYKYYYILKTLITIYVYQIQA